MCGDVVLIDGIWTIKALNYIAGTVFFSKLLPVIIKLLYSVEHGYVEFR